jgi:hypothetical protein
MISLRTVHLTFMLLAIAGADLVGAWAIWSWARTGDVGRLVLGVVCVLGGVGLVLYVVHFVKRMDAANIH